MSDLSGEGTLSVGVNLTAAGEVLRRVSKEVETSWNVESADPQERTALAVESGLRLDAATAKGVEALVALAERDSRWSAKVARLTVAIAVMTFAALVVSIVALVMAA